MNNSVNEIVKYLEDHPFTCEDIIFFKVFGFTRGGFYSNKKYAEMLRRGIRKGIIARVEAKVKGRQSRFFYYVPRV